ncbi:MAG: SDR family NAD(P)-dependent oxidoreductase [Lentisphaerae bacterium]|nr:SDR family NAD(P)-dependent oxidoreductase [Lentisphaerota bacterium]
MKYVVITGVSSGIGHDTALHLAERGLHVFGSVRRAADADTLCRTLGDRFTPLCFDVTDDDAIKRAVEVVRERVGKAGLAGLVNNAGCSVNGPLLHVPLQDLIRQFDVNVYGVYRTTQAFLPLLGACRPCPHPPGRLVIISSTSGRLVYPFFGVYAASKHAVEALADGYRRELLLYGIRVSVVAPGVVNTPIWDKTETASPYLATDYGPFLAARLQSIETLKHLGLPPAAISRVVCRALLDRHPRTRYVVVPGGLLGRACKWWIPRLLGDWWLDSRIRKAWGV